MRTLRAALISLAAGVVLTACSGGGEEGGFGYCWELDESTGEFCVMIKSPIVEGEVYEYDQNGGAIGPPRPLDSNGDSYFTATSSTASIGVWANDGVTSA